MSIAIHGEALIDLIADDNGACHAHLGGSPFNVAIGLARQGVEVSYLSSFSDDRFGDQLRAALIEQGVHVPDRRRSLLPTSLALVSVDEDGQPAYRLYRQGIADKDTSFKEIVDHLPENLAVFHTGSLALTPSQLPLIRKLFGYLRERDVVISMDINLRLRASADTQAYLEGVRSLWPLADIVKASDEDLEPFALARSARDSARALHQQMGAGLAVVTEGRSGAVLLASGVEVECRAYPVEQVADTVGAGDTFHGALLASLLRSGAIRGPYGDVPPRKYTRALELACAAASINVSREGCSPPTRAEAEALVARGRD